MVKNWDFSVASVQMDVATGKVRSVAGSCVLCGRGGGDLEPFVSPSTGFLSGRCRDGCEVTHQEMRRLRESTPGERFCGAPAMVEEEGS